MVFKMKGHTLPGIKQSKPSTFKQVTDPSEKEQQSRLKAIDLELEHKDKKACLEKKDMFWDKETNTCKPVEKKRMMTREFKPSSGPGATRAGTP